MILWDDKYTTGVQHIDSQHKQLFRYINNLELAVVGDVVDNSVVNEAMDFLEMYTRVHFCYEEVCMKRAQCAVAKKNKRQHDSFINIFMEFKKRFKDDGISKDSVMELYDLSDRWITNHIMKIDINLKSCSDKLNVDSEIS